MIVFKGFNKDLACTRGAGCFRYEIGATATAKEAQTAHTGLHSCREPFGVLNYYSNYGTDRYCICEAAGDINEDGDHRVSSTELTPLKELTPQELAMYEAAWIEKHPLLPYSSRVLKDSGADNGFFAVVRGKDPEAEAKTEGTVLILIQEFKTKRTIKSIKVFNIKTGKDKGRYGMEGKYAKGTSKKTQNAICDSGDIRPSKRRSSGQ